MRDACKGMCLAVLCGGLVFSVTARAGDVADSEKAPLRVLLTLKDGSRIVGVPSVEELKLVSSLGKIAVPLKTVAQVVFNADKETASVSLANGDRLSAVVEMGTLHLETVWGKVKIDQEHMKTLDVMSGVGVLSAALREGLQLHYVFDKDPKDSVPDRSGHERNGKTSGTGWAAADAMGGALVFKGGSARVDFPANGLPAGNSPRTLAVWVYQEELGGRYYAIGYGGDPFGTEFRMSLNEFTPGQFSLETGMGGWHSSATLLAKRWYHLAISCSGSGSPKFYVNGVEVPAPGTFLSPAIRTVAAGGTLGVRGSNEGGGFLKGKIVEAGIWNRELGAEEVSALYRLRSGMSGAGVEAQ